MKIYGLIGQNLSHSFSVEYFKKKFKSENIKNSKYINLEIKNINEIDNLIRKHEICGLNVTIPFKEEIIEKLDDLSDNAKKIGAVNTIEFKNNKMIGHNTDIIGFKKSIYPLIKKNDSALVLGNGGSAKAIKIALKNFNINFKVVNRNSKFNYENITDDDIINNRIIINTTPLGMYPKIDDFPKIAYNLISKNHLLFDLIYNPTKTKFLKFGEVNKSFTKNGYEMLKIQAEESWKIWTS